MHLWRFFLAKRDFFISLNLIEKVEDVLQLGDIVNVKLLEIDAKTGKLRLSRKALIEKPEGYVEPERKPRPAGNRPPRKDGDSKKGPRKPQQK